MGLVWVKTRRPIRKVNRIHILAPSTSRICPTLIGWPEGHEVITWPICSFYGASKEQRCSCHFDNILSHHKDVLKDDNLKLVMCNTHTHTHTHTHIHKYIYIHTHTHNVCQNNILLVIIFRIPPNVHTSYLLYIYYTCKHWLAKTKKYNI